MLYIMICCLNNLLNKSIINIISRNPEWLYPAQLVMNIEKWILSDVAIRLGKVSNLKIQRQQVGAVHAGRSSWLRSTDRISVFKLFIGVGKVKIPKAVNDIPCGVGDGIRVRIVFTKISNNKVLVVGMTATINR